MLFFLYVIPNPNNLGKRCISYMIIMEPTVILGAYLLSVLWQFILTYWDYYINLDFRYDFKDSHDQWLKWNFDIMLVGVWEKKTRPFVICVNNRVIIIDFSSPLRPHSELIHTRGLSPTYHR